MQFWFARGSGVPIREQLVTQIVLAILCGELPTGRRLPSTREMARRFRIHPNTVSAAYRELENDRWVESRRGSGVFVCRTTPSVRGDSGHPADRLISEMFRSARELGIQPAELRSRLQGWLTKRSPDHLLVVEPDVELRRIILAEVRQATTFPVQGIGLEECKRGHFEGAIVASMPSASELVRSILPVGTDHVEMQLRSATAALAPWLPLPADTLIAVASRCGSFLKLAHTMLLAAGFRDEALIIRNAREPGWDNGLAQAAAIVCDVATSAELPQGCRPIIFPLISDASLSELRAIAQGAVHPQL